MQRTPSKNALKPPDWFIRLCRWFWGKRSFVWGAIILNLVLGVIVTLLFTEPTNITKLPIGWAFQNPLIIVIVFLVLLSLTIISGVVSRLPREARILFMVEDLPSDLVSRPREFQELITKLLDQAHKRPVAITAALRGAGGYGKTTMAMALCHDQRIRRAFRDGILWVTLGENLTLDKLIGKVEDLIYTLTHERPGFAGLEGATTLLVELLTDRQALIVVDDVWSSAHLKPFLQGGHHCARLITTRDDSVLPPDAQRISVDAMQQQEAVQLLRAGVDGVPPSASENEALQKLAARLGEWPLLLKLANGVLRKQVLRNKQTLQDALAYVNQALDEHGLTAFDARNAQYRNQAVAQTLGVSFGLLSKEEYACYRELAVFPNDVAIPLATLQKLWRATSKLNNFGVREFCERLYDLSLLLNFDPTIGTIRLHDVIRSYLHKAVGAALPALHAHLLDAYKLKRWADLPDNEPYLWDHLAGHLADAGRHKELVATVKDLRYLAHKTLVRTTYAAEADLAFAEQLVPTDLPLHLLTRSFASMSHLLNRCHTYNEIAAVLYSWLLHLQELSDIRQTFEPDIPRPYLTCWHLLTYLPDSALIRTLSGHTDVVTGCAISPSGDFIVSASDDQTLKVWNAHTGEEQLILSGHTNAVTGCAISPSGDFIVSASDDRTLKVWGARTGEERRTLHGHTNAVTGCAISPSGDFIVSASDDRTLKVWDARTGEERRTLRGHRDGVRNCAISSSGDFIISASRDQTLKVWDVHTGEEQLTLSGHTDVVTGCAISPAGDFIVSASDDHTLKVWNAHTGEERRTLSGHTDVVAGCAISPAGDFIVSASSDDTLKVWNARTGACLSTLYVDGPLDACAIHPDGEHIVAVGMNGVYFLRWVK